MGIVNSCCCGCTLQQGTVATGIYCLIDAIINFSSGLYVLRHLHDMNYHDYIYYKSDYESYGTTAVLFSSIGILVTTFLLYGVAKQKRGFLMPWMIVYGITMIIGFPTLIYVTATVTESVGVTIVQALAFSLMIYLYIVVYSYYKSYDQQAVYATTYPQQGFVVQSTSGSYSSDAPVGYTNPAYSTTTTKQPIIPPPYPPNLYPPPTAVAYTVRPAEGEQYPQEPPPPYKVPV